MLQGPKSNLVVNGTSRQNSLSVNSLGKTLYQYQTYIPQAFVMDIKSSKMKHRLKKYMDRYMQKSNEKNNIRKRGEGSQVREKKKKENHTN